MRERQTERVITVTSHAIEEVSQWNTSLIFISEWPLKMILKKTKNLIWGNTKLLDKVLIDLMFLFLSNILQPFLFSFVLCPMCHLDLLLRYILILYGWHWRMSIPLVLCAIVLNWWCTFFMQRKIQFDTFQEDYDL